MEFINPLKSVKIAKVYEKWSELFFILLWFQDNNNTQGKFYSLY